TIEDENVRRAETAVRLGGLLRLAVVEIWKREALLLGVELHLVVAVVVFAVAKLADADALGAVGIDGHGRDAARFHLVGKRNRSRLGGVGIGAVIGKKGDDEN